MQGTHMVPLIVVPDEFAGRVLVAKLGSAGILAEVRGVNHIYPSVLSQPEVWVEAGEFSDARELISTDVDDVLGAPATSTRRGRSWAVLAFAALALAVMLIVTFANGMHGTGTSGPTTTAAR
ncbi:MAG: hypothetical protein ACYDH6_02450 [Acidimicrobiales bacterium]